MKSCQCLKCCGNLRTEWCQPDLVIHSISLTIGSYICITCVVRNVAGFFFFFFFFFFCIVFYLFIFIYLFFFMWPDYLTNTGVWFEIVCLAEGPSNTVAAEVVKQTYTPSFTMFEEDIGFRCGLMPIQESASEDFSPQASNKTEEKSLWKKLTGQK